MKQSERNEIAKRQQFEKPTAPIMAGDTLAGDQYARKDWQERIEAGDTTLSRLATAHRAFRDGHMNLRQAYESRDPTVTEDQHFMQTRALGDKWLANAATASDRAREFAETEMKLERAALENELGIVESHRAAEIRSMMRSLSVEERGKLLQDAVASKDAETVAAITTGPFYLSGLTADQAKALRRQFEMTHGGDRLARLDAIEKAIAINRQTALEAMEFNEKLLPGYRSKQIAEKQRAARELRERMSAEQL